MAQSAFTTNPPVPGIHTGQAMTVTLEASCVTYVGLLCKKSRGDYLCLGELRYASPHDVKEELTIIKQRERCESRNSRGEKPEGEIES